MDGWFTTSILAGTQLQRASGVLYVKVKETQNCHSNNYTSRYFLSSDWSYIGVFIQWNWDHLDGCWRNTFCGPHAGWPGWCLSMRESRVVNPCDCGMMSYRLAMLLVWSRERYLRALWTFPCAIWRCDHSHGSCQEPSESTNTSMHFPSSGSCQWTIDQGVVSGGRHVLSFCSCWVSVAEWSEPGWWHSYWHIPGLIHHLE